MLPFKEPIYKLLLLTTVATTPSRKTFWKNYPPIQEIYKNYSIFFLNTNSILHPIRPILPNVIQIWEKSHITQNKPLPTDLENVLNKSTKCVIYFSLGSNVKSKYISSHIMEAMITVFKELPYTILWKFEDEQFPNKPDNVIISKWFPQQDVLRHPNIKLFITQGGLQSFDEALEAKVPLLGIPIMGDQKSNVVRIANKGLGIILEYKLITKDTFKSAILEAINNSKYRKTVQMYAELLGHQPSTTLERAIWWTEYVLRHKEAPHLKNPAHDMSWYRLYYLDLISLCLFLVYFMFSSICMILRAIKRLLQHPKEKKM